MTQALSIEEAAAALDKPVAHIEAMASCYAEKGAEPRSIATAFELIESHHAADLGGTHVVIRQQQLRAEGRDIYLSADTVERCEDAGAAERRAAELNRAG